MSDIVKRLRRATTATGMYGVCNEAADEIERLRGLLARWAPMLMEARAYCLYASNLIPLTPTGVECAGQLAINIDAELNVAGYVTADQPPAATDSPGPTDTTATSHPQR